VRCGAAHEQHFSVVSRHRVWSVDHLPRDHREPSRRRSGHGLALA
jgi:hypothetical protein